MNILLEQLPSVCLPLVTIHASCVVKPQMFALHQTLTVFSDINATKPDITIIDETNRNVFILEVGCCFDPYLEETR